MSRKYKPRDNSHLDSKIELRKSALAWLDIDDPLVLETCGGTGVLFSHLYTNYQPGAVIEKRRDLAPLLRIQRPRWRVYIADSASALGQGLLSHLKFDLVDVDPHGRPWVIIDRFLASKRLFPDRFVIVWTDGAFFNSRIQRGFHKNERKIYRSQEEYVEIKSAQLRLTGYSVDTDIVRSGNIYYGVSRFER